MRTLLLFLVGLVAVFQTGCVTGPPAHPNLRTSFTNWNGWPASLKLENNEAEIVVVPQVGRIMSFGYRGEAGPFWDNPIMYGRKPDPVSKDWGNFGGDKTWPAPQDDFQKMTGRSWPPPSGFDSVQNMGVAADGEIKLISPTDPNYGIRTVRTIRLSPDSAVMTVDTVYEKLRGKPIEVSVWIISQLDHPEAVFVPVAPRSIYPKLYNPQWNPPVDRVSVANGFIRMTRDTAASHKIGSDGDSMLWVGRDVTLQIDSPRIAGGKYPDNGSSVEVYTNQDPNAYVELETVGPLKVLKKGDKLSARSVYTLRRRTQPTPEAEAAAIYRR